MTDDLGLFADESGERRRAPDPNRFRRRKRRRIVTAVAALFVIALVGVGVLYGASQLMQIGTYDDFEGQGSGDVVIEVKQNDTVSAIARTLADKGVVASSKAFIKASEDNRQVNSIQPGYYLMRGQMSGEAAVARILSPEATVGRVDIRAGMRLDDQLAPDGGHTPGVLTRLAQASCAGADPSKCSIKPEDMHRTAETADLASLGVPQWAIADAAKAEPGRRLEGLIMPGLYDVKPGETAEVVLRDVVTRSAASLEVAGLPQAAEGTRYSPYQLLIIASMVQSEGIAKDFSQISRVIHNRLTPPAMHLGLDSTINYPLDKPALLTKDEDRALPGPYNTYKNYGLPPTPISSVSKEAVEAAEKPIEGRWKYFVKCYPDGTSCFAETPQQHDAFVNEARARGAF